MQARYAFLLLALMLISLPVHAQSQFGSAEMNIYVTARPEHPAPGESVLLTAESSQADLERSDITWYVNNNIVVQGPGAKEAVTLAGPLGSETEVFVLARSANGESFAGRVLIRPVEIDLLWESDSYVPPFYLGRALPSAGTTLRVQAVARFKTPDGASVTERDIIYTWKRNGVVQRAISGRGKSSVQLSAPPLFGAVTVEVEAVSLDGSLVGQAIVLVPSVEPVLALYKNHPLFGVMYHQALTGQTFIPDSEMTFTAVPYFAQAKDPNDPRLIYAWKVNGKNISAGDASPGELTINANKSNGLARIELLLTHSTNWLTQSNGVWGLSFSSAGNNSDGAGPFQTLR